MATDAAAQGRVSENDVAINFPVLLTVSHDALDASDMFDLAAFLDLYEMRESASGDGGVIKERFLVDVLDVTRKETRLKVTPARSWTYQDLARHVETLLEEARSVVPNGTLRLERVILEIGKTGVASDIKGTLRSIG